MAPIESELRNFSNCSAAAKSYEAVPQQKLEKSAGLPNLISILQSMSSCISQVLVIIVVTGLFFHFVSSISAMNAGSPGLRSSAPDVASTQMMFVTPAPEPVLPATPPQPQIATIPATTPNQVRVIGEPAPEQVLPATPPQPQTATIPAATPSEVTETETSRYNHDYYCTVKRARQTGPTSVAVEFIEVGDRSLGKLQDPMASTLRWQGGSTKAAKHTYEVDDEKNEVVDGTLLFDGVPQGTPLEFSYGISGYSWAKLHVVLN